jgi:hypothetical protein
MNFSRIKTPSDFVEFNGSYLEDNQIAKLREEIPWVHGQAQADKLWAFSEDLIGQKFSYEAHSI